MRFGFILWGEGGQWNFIAYETLQRIIKIHTIIFQQKYLSERMDMALKSCLVGEVVGLSMGHSHLKQKYKKTAMSVPCNTNMVKCAKLYKGITRWSLADLKPDEEQVLNPIPRAWFLLTAKVCKAAVTANDRHRNNLKGKMAPYPFESQIWISNLRFIWISNLNPKFESQIRISNFLQWVLTYSQAYYWVARTQMLRT